MTGMARRAASATDMDLLLTSAHGNSPRGSADPGLACLRHSADGSHRCLRAARQVPVAVPVRRDQLDVEALPRSPDQESRDQDEFAFDLAVLQPPVRLGGLVQWEGD